MAVCGGAGHRGCRPGDQFHGPKVDHFVFHGREPGGFDIEVDDGGVGESMAQSSEGIAAQRKLGDGAEVCFDTFDDFVRLGAAPLAVGLVEVAEEGDAGGLGGDQANRRGQ